MAAGTATRSAETDIPGAALAYARRGWRVFPVHTIQAGRCTCRKACGRDAGKHPRTRNGLTDATKDPKIITRWWTWWPDAANVAIATGTASGMWVLDVDPRHGGGDALHDLERAHGRLPDTPRVRTGGGGTHIYFGHPGGTVACSAGALGPGLDVRANGGYVVAAPSRHLSTKFYCWEIGFSPDEICLAAAPPWLLDLITACAAGGPGRLRRDGTPLVLVAGQRNDLLYRLACALRRYGIGEAALLECLAAIDRYHAHPPLRDPTELRKIAASAARHAPSERTGTVRVA